MSNGVSISLALVWCSLASIFAQAPTPAMVVVQAANNPAPVARVTAAPAPDTGAIRTALKALEEVKAANAETLKKQETALQQLDEMQKAADQLRIFAHRSGG
jgi:hypothetical protein